MSSRPNFMRARIGIEGPIKRRESPLNGARAGNRGEPRTNGSALGHVFVGLSYQAPLLCAQAFLHARRASERRVGLLSASLIRSARWVQL
jgi:hypothetical protein